MKNNGDSILIVDDEPLNLKILGKVFGDVGYKVSTATGEKETFSILESTPPDLILLDVMLGVENGLDILR